MNVDWGLPAGPAHTDTAFPTLAAVLAPADAVGGPVAVYHYPGRTLQAVHVVADGTLVATDAVPAGGPAPAGTDDGSWWDAGLHAVRRRLPADPALPELAEECRRAGVVPQALADRLLAYLPGRRAVLRLDGTVAKVGDPASTAAHHARQAALWADPRRRFATSRPVRLDAARGVRHEALVEGVGLLRAASPAQALGDAVAAQVAALHAHPAPAGPLADHGAARAVERWRRKTVRTVGRALPDLAPRAAALVDRLAACPPPAAPVLVHGDLHAANVIVGPDGPVLLDLDELGVGDPELDLAVMAGRLLLVAAATGPQPGGPDPAALAVALVAGYDRAAARPLRADAFAWYLAGTLVGRQVKTSIRHLAPGLAALCAHLLDLAEAVGDPAAAPAPDELVAGLAAAAPTTAAQPVR